MTVLWVNLASAVFIDTDTGWLLQCLQRFLAGGTYTDNFFETNPPLSFLVYLPVMPFITQDPYTLKLALIVTFLLYGIIANICVFFLLKKMEQPQPVIILTLTAVLFSQTWAMGMFSICKDYLIFVFLLPMCLTQYLITTGKVRASALSIFSSFLGGIAICIKPHFALIAAMFFLHRLIKTKRTCAIVCAPDFITMLITGVCYLLFIQILFPDYLSTILPYVADLYPDMAAMSIFNMLHLLIFPLFAALILGFIKPETPYKKEISELSNFSLILGLSCFVVFVLQSKGFLYQTIPFMGFTAIAFFMATATLVSQFVARKYASVWITYGMLSLLCTPLLLGFGNAPIPRHNKFSDIELLKKIKELAPNGTYITYDFKPAYLAAPYYFDLKSSSRFGILWPFDALNNAYENTTSENEAAQIKNKFTPFVEMLAQDIVKNNPDVILIPRYPDAETKLPAQKFLIFLQQNPAYAAAFKNYTSHGTIDYDFTIFKRPTSAEEVSVVTFDLYTLSKVPSEGETDTKVETP